MPSFSVLIPHYSETIMMQREALFVKVLQLPNPTQRTLAVLKILRHSKFTTRGKFTIAQGFATATPLALTQLSRLLQAFSPQRGVHSVVNMGDVKTLRR